MIIYNYKTRTLLCTGLKYTQIRYRNQHHLLGFKNTLIIKPKAKSDDADFLPSSVLSVPDYLEQSSVIRETEYLNSSFRYSPVSFSEFNIIGENMVEETLKVAPNFSILKNRRFFKIYE